MTNVALPAARTAVEQLPGCPYKGLMPYTEDDAQYFFGRDRDRGLVIANLMASRLTLLYGPSGVGKSSLLRAGVVRALRGIDEDAFDAFGHPVVAYHAAWRDDPFLGIADALRTALVTAGMRPSAVPLGAELSVDLLRAILSHDPDCEVYLILDQFEEFFLYQDDDVVTRLGTELGRLIAARDVRVSIVVGIRDDALTSLDRFEGHVPGLFENFLRMSHLDEDAAREAIECPLERYNQDVPAERRVRIEPELTLELLGQLRTGSVTVTEAGKGEVTAARETQRTIETPFLQLVMTRLWEEEAASGSTVLRAATLARLGGAERIVRTHLDAVLADFTDEERDTAATVFRHLVTPSGTKIAHTASDLADYAGLTSTQGLTDVLERLASGRQRVLRPVPPPMSTPGPPRYEIFHDVIGPAVLDWRRRYVAERERARAEAGLVEARRAAEEKHRQTRRRLLLSRIVSATLAVLLVGVVILGFAAKSSKDKSDKAKQETEAQVQLSRYEQELPFDPAASLHAAVAAWNMRPDSASEQAVRTALEANHLRAVIRGHRGAVMSSELSPDGARLLTAGADGTALVSDARTGDVLRRLRQPGAGRSPLSSASFSPDGTKVLVASRDGEVRMYDAATGRQLFGRTDFEDWVSATWGTMDGRDVVLATAATADGQAHVLDAATGELMGAYGRRPSTGVFDADLSPDGRFVVTLGYDLRARVWDAASGLELSRSAVLGQNAWSPRFVGTGSRQVVLLAQNDIDGRWVLDWWRWGRGAGVSDRRQVSALVAPSLVVSADRSVVAVTDDKRAVVVDVTSRQRRVATPLQDDMLGSVAVTTDGRWIATGGRDGRVLVWDGQHSSRRPVLELVGHRGLVQALTFASGDAQTITSAGADGTARIWQFPARTVLPVSDRYWALDASYSADGRRVVTVESYGTVQAWSAQGDPLHSWFYAGAGSVTSAAFTPDGTQVVTTTTPSWAPAVWTEGEDTQRDLDSEYLLTSASAVSPDGARVAAGDAQNRVIIWGLADGAVQTRLTGGSDADGMNDAGFVPGSDLVFGASGDGTVRLWDPSRPARPVRTLGAVNGPEPVSAEASPDGRLLATASDDAIVRVWRLRDGKLLQALPSLRTSLADVSFSPDSRLLAVAAADANVYVWDWKEGRRLASMRRHGDYVNSVSFSPDGKRLLTASDDGTAAVYTCTTCGPFAKVLARATALDRRLTAQP